MLNDKTKKRIKRALLCLLLLLLGTAIIWAVSQRPWKTRIVANSNRTLEPSPPDVPRPKQQETPIDPVYRAPYRPRQTYFQRPVTQHAKYRCPLTAPSLEELQTIERNLKAIREANPTPRAAGTVTIPVYFHILTNADGTQGNVSTRRVERQIDVLNAAFAGTGPGGTGQPTPFKFELKEIDRTPNNEWFNMTYRDDPVQAEKEAKTELNKGDASALNIYTINLTSKPYGWARWPWDLDEDLDGIVIGYKTMPGGGLHHFNEGDTATHEVGHWLGLFHTYEGGCTSPGDFINDTPPETGGGFCDSRDTCIDHPGEDAITNFMNSTDDVCIFTFSAGQSDRMDAVHLRYRPSS